MSDEYDVDVRLVWFVGLGHRSNLFLLAPYTDRIPTRHLEQQPRTRVRNDADEVSAHDGQCRALPVPIRSLLLYTYPNLYPIHRLFDSVTSPPLPVQLTFANIDRNGVYLRDAYDHLYIYICKLIHSQSLADVFRIEYGIFSNGFCSLSSAESQYSEYIDYRLFKIQWANMHLMLPFTII